MFQIKPCQPRRSAARFIISLSLLTAIAGCSNIEDWSIVHKIDIHQGNVLEQENINKLRPGMTPDQVRFLLGTPALVDAFHQDRWDYLYRIKPGGRDASQRRLTLFFENRKLARIEGDMPPLPEPADGAEKPATQVVVVPQVVPEEPGIFSRVLSGVGLTDD